MKKQNRLNTVLIAMIAIAMGLACGGKNQIEEAGKTLNQANRKLDEAKNLYSRTERRNTNLFSADIRTFEELQDYKNRMSGEAESIVDDYERAAQLMSEVSGQYDEVSRMNLGEKYKDYARLKSDEFAKRAEAVSIRKDNTREFMEIDDPRTMTMKLDETNSKSDRLFKDADDMGAKAKKMEEENKNIFKRL